MKKIITIACLLAAATGMKAQNDTLSILRPDSVRIERTDENVRINVYGNDQSHDYRYSMNFDVNTAAPVETNEKSGRRELETLGIPLFTDKTAKNDTYYEFLIGPGFLWGMNFTSGAPDDIDIEPARSFDIWFPGIAQFNMVTAKKRLSVGLAYGLEWRNFRMTDNKRFIMNENYATEIGNYPEAATPRFSRIKILSQTLSLTARYNVTRKLRLRFGSVLSINSGLSVLTKYKNEAGKKVSEKQNDPKVNHLTLEWLASIQYSGIGVFVKYTPANMLKKGFGPQFSNTSIGLSIGW